MSKSKYDYFFESLVEAIKTGKDVYVNEFVLNDDEYFQKEENEHYIDFYVTEGISFEKIQNQLMWLIQEDKLSKSCIVSIEAFFVDDCSVNRMYITTIE